MPGDAILCLVRLSDNSTPLVAYSLDVNIGGEPAIVEKVTGRVPPAADPSNFYEAENLITQGGGVLHAGLSYINDGGHGGVYATALNESFANVELAAAGHDVLAQLVIDVALDAPLGTFTLDLGVSTALVTNVGGSPPQFEDVPFEFDPVTIAIIPEPGGLGLFVVASLALLRRRGLGFGG